MKKIILLGAITLTAMTAIAQDYKDVLDKTFTSFDTTWDQTRQMEASNKLALIAKKWDNEWTAHYYLAYSKIVLTYMEKDNAKKEAWLDEAEKELGDAISILKKESDETFVLAAMIANTRMGIDPMNRWQKYGPIFRENLEKAKDINPDNPRMYYLTGVSKFYTPKAYGGGKKAAQPYFEKAEELLAKEGSKDILQPHWGKGNTDYFLKQCNEPDKDN